MATITDEIKSEVEKIIYDFFSEECEVEISDLKTSTRIIEDLDGDSLLFVELVEILKKKYALDIQLQTLGKYLIKNPAETIGQVIELSQLIIEHGNGIVEIVKR